ncbi:MAG: hypothetical protein OEU26_24330 [Candidatus Tectomicrobia bacterium]|nr:hypothetical protein [Candidatus Tectomicrobia bacterium]
MKEIETRSKGRLVGKVFPASQLGNNVQRIEQLQLGTLECTVGAVAFLSGVYPPVTIFDLPFLPLSNAWKRVSDSASCDMSWREREEEAGAMSDAPH